MNWAFSLYDKTWRPPWFFIMKQVSTLLHAFTSHTQLAIYKQPPSPHPNYKHPIVEPLPYTPQFPHPIEKCMKWYITVEN